VEGDKKLRYRESTKLLAVEACRSVPTLQLYALDPQQSRAISRVLDRNPDDSASGDQRLGRADAGIGGWALWPIGSPPGTPAPSCLNRP
jgi:hypothetical protein